jgi:sulfur relay (sulfurtransferase) DsrF/TusC family protein
VRGLTAENLVVPVEVLSAAELGEMMEQQDVLINC